MTQTRLLETAIREFGAKGLEGASTREIAAKAGTAMSSITYHFGGKEGLYRAAAEHIAAKMSEVTHNLAIEAMAQAASPQEARDLIKLILGRVLEKVSRSQNEALFIVREQMNPTEAFNTIYKGAMGPLWHNMAQLVSVATGHDDMRTCRIVTMMLLGQVISIRAGRAIFERLVGTSLDDRDLLDQIKATISANTDAILDRLSVKPENFA